MPTTTTNVLLIQVDQMQAACLGCAGHPDLVTPNLDRLAAAGTRFTRAYCNNPVCTPSRMSTITGLLPSQHGVLTNGQRPVRDQRTFPQALAEAGYRTHCVGKCHFEPFMHVPAGLEAQRADDAWPPTSWEDQSLWDTGVIESLPSPYYGYQSTDYLGGHVDYHFGAYRRWLLDRHPELADAYSRDASPRSSTAQADVWPLAIPREAHYNDWIVDRGCRFLDAIGETPFLLTCSFPDPHHPFCACPPFCDQYDLDALALPDTWAANDDLHPLLARRRAAARHFGPGAPEAALRAAMAQTYGMISHLDDCIGRLLDRLDRNGLGERTVVIFHADHGEYLGAHGLLYKGPSPYEAVQTVPLICRAPDGRAGQIRDDVISLVDLAPTVLDYAGLESSVLDRRRRLVGDDHPLPGRSLRAALAGAADADRPAFLAYDDDFQDGPMLRYRGVVRTRYKLGIYAGEGDGILVDLAVDPEERHNRWNDPALAGIRAELLHELALGLACHDRLDQSRVCGA